MHQPDYLPWLGYFNKIAVSDIFIFYDTAFYSRDGFHNRNKIKTANGDWAYITVPVAHTELFKRLKDVILPADTRWAKKHWRSLEVHYRAAPYWKDYSDFFNQLYANIASVKTLSDLNIKIIEYMSGAFGCKVKFFRSSEFEINPDLRSTGAILDIIKNVEATKFLAGPSGKKYINQTEFSDAKVELIFQEFHPQEYKQLFPPFVPGLTALDLLFNEGPNSINFLK